MSWIVVTKNMTCKYNTITYKYIYKSGK